MGRASGRRLAQRATELSDVARQSGSKFLPPFRLSSLLQNDFVWFDYRHLRRSGLTCRSVKFRWTWGRDRILNRRMRCQTGRVHKHRRPGRLLRHQHRGPPLSRKDHGPPRLPGPLSCRARTGPVPGIRTLGLAEHQRQSRGHCRRIGDSRSRGTIQNSDREGAPMGSAADPVVMGRCSHSRHPKPCPLCGVALLGSRTKHTRLEPNHFECLNCGLVRKYAPLDLRIKRTNEAVATYTKGVETLGYRDDKLALHRTGPRAKP
jgi:hypothetical protein